jgi:hypothetical protein
MGVLMKTWCAVIMTVGMAILSENARGANAHLTEAEGGIGLQAWLEVDKRYGVFINLNACEVDNKMGWICVGLDFQKRNIKLPRELDKLAFADEGAKINLGLCVNETCEAREWEFGPTGYGDMFTTKIAIEDLPRPIRLIGIVLESGKRFEYRGDVDHIVNRICSVALCQYAKCQTTIPLPKEGCPVGYYASTDFNKNVTCRAAPPRRGKCPEAFSASGEYCIPRMKSGSGFLLPSQETPDLFNVRICSDRQVLSAIKTAADGLLKTKTRIARGSPEGPGWDPEDIQMEAVSAEKDRTMVFCSDRTMVFCSMTIEANETTERIVYVVGPTQNGDSWQVKFGGDFGPKGGGHKLFPKQITVSPSTQ